MTRQRTLTATLLAADAEARHVWFPNDPLAGTVAGNNSLDSQVAKARREMGEAKWHRLNAEWSASGEMGKVS